MINDLNFDVSVSIELQTNLRKDFAITMEKAPTDADHN